MIDDVVIKKCDQYLWSLDSQFYEVMVNGFIYFASNKNEVLDIISSVVFLDEIQEITTKKITPKIK